MDPSPGRDQANVAQGGQALNPGGFERLGA